MWLARTLLDNFHDRRISAVLEMVECRVSLSLMPCDSSCCSPCSPCFAPEVRPRKRQGKNISVYSESTTELLYTVSYLRGGKTGAMLR